MKKSIAIVVSIMIIFAFVFPVSAFSTIAVKSIKLNNNKITLNVGITSNLLVTFSPTNTTQKKLTYTTGNKKIATVSATGKITGVGSGTTTITVYTLNSKIRAKCIVTVVKPVVAPIFKKYNTPVEITTATWINSDIKYRSGDTFENNPWTRMVKEKFGIVFKNVWSAPGWADYEQKITLNIGAGEDFPDVLFDFFNQGDATLAKIMENNDLLLSVKDAFDKYASPTVKKIYEKAGDSIWIPFMKDGKAYGLPIPNDGIGNLNSMYYRQDWLDAVGLPVPKTIKELDKVLDAFVNKDPDKNNKKDTYGMTFAWKDKFSTYLSDTSWLFGAYGAIPGIWTKGSDGKLAYGSIQPQIKDGLAKLRDWYSKGYIDSQAAMLAEFDANGKDYVAEKTGAISGPSWTSYILGDLTKNNPNAKTVTAPIPVGDSGKPMMLGYNKLGSVFFFSKDFKNMEAFFDYFNSLYERANPDSKEFRYGWIEGCDYAMLDGKPVFNDDIKKVVPEGKYDSMNEFMVGKGGIGGVPYENYEAAKKLATGAKAVTPTELAQASSPDLAKKAQIIIYDGRSYAVADEFNGPTTKTMTSKKDQLLKKEHEVFLKIIYGQLPLDEYDKFVIEWKSEGGNDITKEVNDWYSGAMKK